MAILKVQPNAIDTTGNFAVGAVTTTGNVTVGGQLIVNNTILPTSANVIDIGSPTMRFGALYLAGNTIDIGGTLITTGAGGDLSFTTQSGNIAITANTVSFLSTVANTVTEAGSVAFDGNVNAYAIYTDSYFYANGTPFTGARGYSGSAGTNGYVGSRGDTGLGFTIAKSYASVAALTADTSPTSIVAGQFALIETGNVNDADNSKLYLWTGSAYSYVNDLSGAAGITGPAGYTGSASTVAGYTGSAGTLGYTGSAGSAGSVGYTGSAGSAGSAGYTGSAGSAGSAGTTGVTGYTGSAGTAGSAGTSGYTGSRGTTAFTSGNTAPLSPSLGDMWYRTTNDALYRYLNDGTASYWIDVTGPVNNFGTSAATSAIITSSAIAPPTVIGQSYAGGYYAGQISATGTGTATHYLVIAPKATGESTGLLWKNADTTTSGTSSDIDGPTNSANMNNASHPAAQFCEALTIGGYSDWYLPSKNELEVCYYNLKPSGGSNNYTAGGNGSNPNAVPSRGSGYTSGTPGVTSASLFSTGSEAFGSQGGGSVYWSSTESGDSAWCQVFGTGWQLAETKSGHSYIARAVRRVAI